MPRYTTIHHHVLAHGPARRRATSALAHERTALALAPTRARRRAVPAGTALAVALMLASAPVHLRAQDAKDPHAAQPERPTVATHAYTVAPGWWEVEAGGQYQRPRGGSETDVPMLLKIGVAPGVQLDVGETWTETHTAAAGTQGGPGDLSLAAKVRVGKLPFLGDFSVQPVVSLPTGSVAKGTGTGEAAGTLLLISSHQFGPVEIDANTAWTVSGGDGSTAPKNAWLWAVSGGFPLSGPLGWTSEVFGYPGTTGSAGGPPQVGILFGPTYAAHPWLVFDAGAIVNVEHLGANSVFAGVTANLGRLF